MGYSPWKSLGKGAVSYVKTLAGVLLTALVPVALAFLQDPQNVFNALKAANLDPALIVVLTPFITMAYSVWDNWRKNRKRGN